LHGGSLLFLKAIKVYSKACKKVRQNIRRNAFCLLAPYALRGFGNREIESGKFRDAERVFADLDKADRQ
jgi:hypothetical protein